MEKFDYYNPVCTYFGEGRISEISNYLKNKYKCYLLVTSKTFKSNETGHTVIGQLEKAGGKVVEIGSIPTNPKMENIYEGVDAAREHYCDCIVALGGGSVMDCSKIIAMAARTGIDARNYLWGDADENTDSIDTVMIPTIAATGTELNNTAVAVDKENKEKFWCYTAFPKYCFMDPQITCSLSKKLTIWGAMDILSHTFEYYMNGNMESEFQLRFSESLIMAVMDAVEKLVVAPLDVHARGEIMWCSTMTWGTGLTKIGRGEAEMSCHNIEERFSGYFDTHHGGGLGVITPRWMLYVYKKAPEIFSRFARNVMRIDEKDDPKAAGKGINAFIGWLKKIGAPQTYSDLNPELKFEDNELDIVAEKIWNVCHGQVGKLVPLELTDIKEILYAGKNELEENEDERI